MKTYTEEQIERRRHALRMSLIVMGFAAAKELALMRQDREGVMPCPLCQRELRYSISTHNGHMATTCDTPDCLTAME